MYGYLTFVILGLAIYSVFPRIKFWVSVIINGIRYGIVKLFTPIKKLGKNRYSLSFYVDGNLHTIIFARDRFIDYPTIKIGKEDVSERVVSYIRGAKLVIKNDITLNEIMNKTITEPIIVSDSCVNEREIKGNQSIIMT